MAEQSKIEWTDMTLNFVAGCSKVSEGCRNCYAIKDAWRMSRNPNEKIASVYRETVKKEGNLNWTGKVVVVEERLKKPLRIGKPKRIFVNSMSDLFHQDVAFEVIDGFLAVVASTPRHTYQVLTKRPERMLSYFSRDGVKVEKNLWLGVSCEDQEAVDKRIPILLKVPASIKFVSCEPLLGKVDLTEFIAYLDWVIIGGESGSKAREMKQEWVEDLIGQCERAKVKVFYKQKVEKRKKISLPVLNGRQYVEMP